MIKLQVIGHLGKDAEVKSINGKTVINFSVAHTEKYKDRDGNPTSKTTWVECAQWTEKTGVAPYLKKGASVYAEGTPEVRTFEKGDGSTGTSLTLRVASIQLLGGGKQDGGQPAAQDSINSDAPDDLPF